MMRRFALPLALLLPWLPARARTPDQAPDAALDRVLTQGEARPLAALAALRVHDDAVTYRYFGGFARLNGDGTAIPVTEDTLFRIASVSKVVTTIGLMRLVEEGKVDLDRDVSAWLGFPLRNPDFPDVPITLRMLLSHTATLSDGDGYTLPPGHAVAEFFAPGGGHFIRGHRPGTWFEYCNLCFGLAGTVIERVSRERFDRYMRAHVLDPLGIDGGYDVAELAHPERVATLYRHGASGWEVATDAAPLRTWPAAALASYTPGTNGTLFSPQGGLRISVVGLARLARFMNHRGVLDGVRVLKEETVALMETPVWRHEGRNGDCPYPISAYGLGLDILDGRPDLSGRPVIPWKGYKGGVMGHLGDAYGLHSGFWFDPAHGDAYLFAADGFPPDDRVKPGAYSSFTRVEEEILTALSEAGDRP